MDRAPLPAFALFGILAGCATVRTSVPFDASAFQPFTRTGSATITGHAFLRTQDGEGAWPNDTVELVPATPYTRERYDIKTQLGPYADIARPDRRMAQYVRTVTTDDKGDFKFMNLPAGDYLLESPESQMEDRDELPTMFQLLANVTVKDGETATVPLEAKIWVSPRLVMPDEEGVSLPRLR